MQILDDLYNETKRLFIAGSKFAKGDPRILKHIPVLEKLGEKAPIMKKLAEKYTLLVKDGQPEALAEAGTFLYAVMATQGATEVSGKIAETAPSIHELPKTCLPHSKLRSVLDALIFSNQGRYEVIKSAFEEGILNDFRLYEPLVAGLDDKYSALADYICENVIPAIGTPLIPYILEQYDPKGKRSDAMRLSLLHKIGYKNAEQLAFNAIEEGDPLVAVEGIKILGANSKNEEYLLTLVNDKKAAIREEALSGLVRMDSARGKELMLKTLQGNKHKNAVQAAKICQDPEYTEKMLNLIKPYYDKLFEKDLPDKEFIQRNNKFLELFGALENKDEPAVYEFFSEILQNKDYAKRLRDNNNYNYVTGDMQHVVCRYLMNSPKEKVLKVCEDALNVTIAKKMPSIAATYFLTALKSYTPGRMFDVFAKYYEAGTIDFKEMFLLNDSAIQDLTHYIQNNEAECARIRSIIDPRWKKVFIEKKDMLAISVLLCEGDEYEQEMKNAILNQLKECAAKNTANLNLGLAVGQLVKMTTKKNAILFKSEFEKLAESCYKVFEKSDGYKAEYFHLGIAEENFLKLFYPEYSEKFKALATRKTSNIFQQIAGVLQEADNNH